MHQENKFKKCLLLALKDQEVVQTLIEVFMEQQFGIKSSLDREELELVKKLLRERDIELETLRENIRILKKDNSRLLEANKTIEEALLQSDREVKRLAGRFHEAEEAYLAYLALPKVSQYSLRGIFKGNSLEEFVFCGIQYDNLESLWEFIKREAIEGHLEGLQGLNTIFQYFFKAYNCIYEKPLYQLQSVIIGEAFDEDYHIRVSNSLVVGNITDVLFQGYINKQTNKIIKKSVVRV